jgi:hypothetical protein
MKKTLTTLSAALLTALVLTACGGGGDSGGPPLVVDAEGVSTFDSTVLGTTLTALPSETLSPAEQATLVYMREEEKLAHDVYVHLATLWGGSVKSFANIATSEATHTEAVRQLLLRYNLADPAASLGAGQFQNPTLQALYTQLVAAGAPALVEALKVGAAIEEIDMVDIQAALVNVDNQDIRLVYENLLKGSRNHLRAFVKALLQQGVTYVPQYMNPADYLAIINTPIERN